MTTANESDILTRVGPGTPMGEMMREYWIPAVRSSEIDADGPPLRLMLLGEKLIAFRDTSGRVGVMDHRCPHRCASLFFGRNEEDGIRCVYHGWKFDVAGNCLDMANLPPQQSFKDKVRAKAYKAVERNGLIWVYMGTRAEAPPLPQFEALREPEETVTIAFVQRACNWLQALEGDIDTSHLSFLHLGTVNSSTYEAHDERRHVVANRTPEFVVENTEWGTTYGAYRPIGTAGLISWRIAHFLFPFWAMPPINDFETNVLARAWVPIDDHHTMFVAVTKVGHGPVQVAYDDQGRRYDAALGSLLPNTTDWYGRFRHPSNRDNDYCIDREVQRSHSYTGIKEIHIQDQAITESMGGTTDHSWEHLAPSDVMIARTRRRLLQTVQAFKQDGILPASVLNQEHYSTIRAGSFAEPEGVDGLESYRKRQNAA